MDDPLAIQREIENSEALRVRNRLQYLIDVFRIFDRNHTELIRLLEGLNDPERMLSIWDVDRIEDLRLLLNELLRFLHNYLASVKTMIDHTRVMINNAYSGAQFIEEYGREIRS